MSDTPNNSANGSSALDIISEGFKFLTGNFGHLLPLILLIAFPNIVVHVINYQKNVNETVTGNAMSTSFNILTLLVSVILGLIATTYVFYMIRHKTRLPFIEALEFGLSKIPKLLPVILLTALFIIGGLLLFIIPGIILSFRYIFTTLVKLDNEKLGAKASLKRSKELFQSHRSLVLRYVLVAIAIVIPFIIFTSFIDLQSTTILTNIVLEVLYAMMSIVFDASLVFLYIYIIRSHAKNQQ